MSPSPFVRARLWSLIALLATVGLAGCLGSDAEPAPTGSPGPTPTAMPTPTATDYTDFQQNGSGGEQVPEAHYHHYWGTPAAPFVTIFDGTVSIDFDACFNQDIEQEPPCFGTQPHLGSVIFDLEDDGSQVTTAEDREAAPNGHADVVFTGSSFLEATFTWEPDVEPLVGREFLFYYRAANSALFMPQGGIRVSLEDPTVTIPLKPGMADPAHQVWVSRWAFMLVANNGPTEDWQMPFYMSNGTVGVKMLSYNGGKSSIDPPHPDFWAGADNIVYGTTTGSFAIQAATLQQENDAGDVNQRVVQGDGHEDIMMPLKAVVPAGTDYLKVKAWVNATGSVAPNFDWALKWHGANTPIYKMVDEYEEADGARVYTIYIGDEEVDPPYEKESFFRFGFVPRVDAADLTGTGVYEASYALGFEVVKKADFTYYF